MGWRFGGQAGAQGDAIGDEGGEVRLSEADARRRLAVVLDSGWCVEVVREGCSQVRILRVRLRIIPADAFLAVEDDIAVVANTAGDEVHNLVDAEFQPVVEVNATSDDGSVPAYGVDLWCRDGGKRKRSQDASGVTCRSDAHHHDVMGKA